MTTNVNPPDTEGIDLDALSYRELAGEHEVVGLARLYDVAGWGPMPPERLASWLRPGGPFGGGAPVVIADDRVGEILGMTIYTPTRVWLGDHEGIGARGRAFVLDPRLRGQASVERLREGTAPMSRLTRAAYAALEARGWPFIYGLPNPTSAGRRKRRQEAKRSDSWLESHCDFGRGLKVLIADEPAGTRPLEVSVGEGAGPEFDVLWDAARRNLGVDHAVMRDAKAFAGARRGFRLECRRPGSSELVGYATFLRMPDGKMNDILAVDAAAMHDVAQSVTSWLREHQDEHPMYWFNSFPHPAYRDALLACGAQETEWDFAFALYAPPGTEAPWFDAAQWYVTTGD